MADVERTEADHLVALQALMPRGPIWPRAIGTGQETVARGLVPSITRLCARARALVTGAFPATALQMLPEWEAALRLPDACTGMPDTLQQRRLQVTTRLAAQGGQSRRYFIGQAAQLGFSVRIEEFRVARADELEADEAVNDPVWAHAWRVHAPSSSPTDFVAEQSAADEPLSAWGNTPLECRLQGIRPGHTTLIFAYDGS
ncbi:putative phage tail protein [Pararoseomonas sp. SCSIO 73927]|uniref:YmfQ family protein n=1 Tax=Pararoseomonas sp. SCSIO 73927 TaxID=3114537 RepID=UPI0030CE6188